MLSRLTEHKTLGVFLFVSLILCGGVCAIPIFIIEKCNQQNQIPNVDVYPNSQLVKQSLYDFGVQRMVNLTYGVNASQQEVLAYFSENLVCMSDSNGTTCSGRLPDGDNEYFIYLTSDLQEFMTSYVVEIRWKGCNWNIQMTE